MKHLIPYGEEKNAATFTRLPQWSKSQMEQCRALQENKWWPFNQADAQVLIWMHSQNKLNPTIDLPDALF